MASNLEPGANSKKKIKVFSRSMNNDITLKIGDDTFMAHKEVLMERMDFFRAMFTVDMQEKHQDTVWLDAEIIDSRAFGAILDYVYNSEVTLTSEILPAILKAVDFFCFDEMKTYVKGFIKDSFSADNIGFLTEIINEFDLKDLEEDRRRYILSDPRLTPQELYVFGGDNTETAFSKYDSRTDKWIELPPMPFGSDSFAYATVNHQIYVCWRKIEGESRSSVHFMFDTNTQQWTELSPMNHPRTDCSMAALDGYLYVAGGMDDQTDAMSTVERYCIANDKWEYVSPMINERAELELVELNGFLYAISCSFAEKYDPRTDHWEDVADANDEIYFEFGSAVLDGRIYIVGEDGFEVYDPQENKWTELPAPDDVLYRRRLSVLNRRLFLSGGENLEDCNLVTKTAYFYSQQGKWIPGKT